jgi:hypothetical protein
MKRAIRYSNVKEPRAELEARARILAARFASELLQASPSKIERAQGRPGAGRTHGPPANKKQAASPQVRAEHPAFPARWF